MSASDHGDDAPTTYRSGPPTKRSGASTVLWLLLLAVIAAPLLYYASVLWQRGEATRAALQASNDKLAQLQKEYRERGATILTLERVQRERDERLLQDNDKLVTLNAELAAAQTRLDELDQERSAIREQLAEFQELMRQFQQMIDSGQLKVTFRRGRMIVELPAQVLFPSGSAELTPEGQKSLVEVAKILRTMRNRRYIVAGHTDNVPVATERWGSNWELSSARAVKVTRELIAGGLRPEQLVAAGYSEYDPVARNTSDASRQQNRRIEIILEPRLAPMPGIDPAATATAVSPKTESPAPIAPHATH